MPETLTIIPSITNPISTLLWEMCKTICLWPPIYIYLYILMFNDRYEVLEFETVDDMPLIPSEA